MIKKLNILVYYLFAQHLPKSTFPGGKIYKKIRYLLLKKVFKYCGKNINIENNAYIGNGSGIRIGNNSGIGERCQLYGKINIDSFSTRKIVFRNGNTLDIKKSGDTVLYFSSLSGKQIIHRAVAKINAEDGVFILTKGDSGKNPIIDQDYPLSYANNAITSYAIPAKEIKGRIFLTIPIIGYAKILIFDDLPHLVFGCRQGEECYFP